MRDRRVVLLGLLIAIGVPALSGCLEERTVTPTTDPDAPSAENTTTTSTAPAGDANRTEDPNSSTPGNATRSEEETTGNGTETNRTSPVQPVDPGWPDPASAPIRPGIAIAPGLTVGTPNEGGGCTSNFLFRGPLNRTLYLGTAGHCVESNETVALTANGTYTATVAWSENSWDQEGANRTDFALLALDDAYRDKVHPKVLYWGGPTGIQGNLSWGTPLVAYGSSLVRGGYDETSRLQGYFMGRCDGAIYGTLPGEINGDSGSLVMTSEGAALGVLHGGGISTGCTGIERAGTTFWAPIDRAIMRAEDDLGMDLELITWPVQREGHLAPLPSPSGQP